MSSDMCVCPYNQSHLVSRLKFPHHLVKCKLLYPHIQLIHCPYNATHLTKTELMEDHLKKCEDKVLIESWKYSLNGNEQHGEIIQTPFNKNIQRTESNFDDWN